MRSSLPLLATVLIRLSAICGGAPATVLPLERVPSTHHVELDEIRQRDFVRHARLLRARGDAAAGGILDFPVQGSTDIVGLYFTRIKLGSPPREFNVQIDTGSDVLWVNCISCNGCPQTSGLGVELNFFDPESSSSVSLVSCSDSICNYAVQTAAGACSTQSNQCTYVFQYGDGSGTSGYYIADALHFDMIVGESLMKNSSTSVIFGCSNYQSGDLTTSDRAVDGIYGFGPGDLSVISQLSSRGITPKVFSHCLRGDGIGGGILVLGEILEPNIVYTPLVPSQPHYNVNLQSIAVDGKLLPIDPATFETSNNRGTIVDCGTTLALLVEEAYNPLVNAITSIVARYATPTISKGFQCYLVGTSINDIFPPVGLNFAGGVSMVLKPNQYLVQHGNPTGDSLWCIAFQKVYEQTILGDTILKDKIFVYDLAHQRIGWADYDCAMAVNVSLFSGKEFINEGQLSTNKSSKYVVFKLFHLVFGCLLTFIVTLLEFLFL